MRPPLANAVTRQAWSRASLAVIVTACFVEVAVHLTLVSEYGYHGDELYFLKGNNGLITCLDAKTGERRYGPERIEGVPNVYASPVGAGGRIYVAGREGSVGVLEAGKTFKLLATNKLEDGFDASPVAVDNELYLRGAKYLYRISE